MGEKMACPGNGTGWHGILDGMSADGFERRSSAGRPGLAELIDLERYPLLDPGGQAYRDVVERARASLRADGCAVLSDLVLPAAVQTLAAEIEDRKPTTHYSTQVMNPYFHTEPDPAYDDRHPVNTMLERSSGFVPGDSWRPDDAMTALFEAPELTRLLADCLELEELHCYADPLAGLTANILDPGQQFTWHFDTNDIAVTVLVAEAADGGLFEYVPGIRSAADEGFAAIQAVLEGGRDGVRTLELRPGDLQIFRGRYSLHRVTRVGEGSAPRHAAIFAYTNAPGVIGRLARTQQLFGRVLPEHEAAEAERVRTDALLD